MLAMHYVHNASRLSITRPAFIPGSTTVAEDVKRALSNNNSSPKSQRSSHSQVDESSDTQSLADATSPNRSKRTRGESDEAAFPQETDRALLLELIRPKRSNGPISENRVDVKRVSSRRYKDSDSSSGSEPGSPRTSSRNESMFSHNDSLRSFPTQPGLEHTVERGPDDGRHGHGVPPGLPHRGHDQLAGALARHLTTCSTSRCYYYYDY